MPNNINTTLSTTSVSTPATFTNKTYYDKLLLETTKTKFKHAEFGQKRTIPKNGGKMVEYRKMELFAVSTTPLVDGVVPDGQRIGQSKVEATIDQYGAYATTSDFFEDTNYDRVQNEIGTLLGEQLGTTLEWVTRDAMNAGTNVQYAGGKTRPTMTAADKLSTTEIRKAVRTLKKAKAPMFSRSGRDHYVCICSPDATFDLQSDPLWQDVSKYSNPEQIYSGEIGNIFGVVFVESTEAKVFTGAGSGGVDVHSALVFGRDAYGVVTLDGGGTIEYIAKPRGSSGAADPLNQIATIGAKVNGFTAKILQPLWILRIEHGVSA